MKATSFVIVDKQTGKAVMETFNRATADAVNLNKFDVLPTLEYLQKLNRDLSMERKSNPTKKFSPAQIAAQKLFAERARAGTLNKRKKRKPNPDKEKPNVYIKRVSQATGAPPTKRLVKRRTKALFAPAGYFPNPYTMGKSKKKANFPYCVETKATENWSIQSCFKTLAPAKEYAVALSKKYPKLAIRVMQYAGGAM